MIYYSINDIIIRDMLTSDPEIITHEEHLQGWTHQKKEKYEQRLKDVADNKCVALVAEYKGNVAGYFNIYFNTMCSRFGGKGFPELIDLGVFKKYRNQGIGNLLMQVAEDIAKKYADTVVIGVGLHHDYGAAQRMYVKRGYIPDGTGLWWQGKPLEPYADLKNDDETAIYMSKKL
ncbi:MAG: GNAT family N-acetyltransferase [Alphaproteobacteria bacterium]|nr:GNAT family N-acetyltransferase [Alphaproteobacteria bacterium]